MSYNPAREDLINLILSAGLVEDFIEWYRKTYNTVEVPSLKELNPSVIEEYARNRGLLSSRDPVEEAIVNTRDEIIKYEPIEVKPRISPKNK